MKKRTFTPTLVLLNTLLFVVASISLKAQSDSTSTNKLNFSGFVDAYYQYGFQKAPIPTSFTERHNSFTLGMANLVVSKDFNKVGFVADVAAGPRAEVANGGAGTLSFIKQLYITYKPTDKLKFTLGNFSTFVGYEYINSTDNLNYSMAYLFSKGPFFNTGLKLDYTINDNWSAMVGIFDDTDSKFDVDGAKHIGAQLSYVNGNFKGYLNYLGGRNNADVNNKNLGHQMDFVASYQLNKLGLGLNVSNRLFLKDDKEDTSWWGTALYANYAVSPKFTLAARGEHFADPDGEIFGIAKDGITAFTLSGNIKIPTIADQLSLIV